MLAISPVASHVSTTFRCARLTGLLLINIDSHTQTYGVSLLIQLRLQTNNNMPNGGFRGPRGPWPPEMPKVALWGGEGVVAYSGRSGIYTVLLGVCGLSL
jgi:hypothetical protein